MKEKVATMFCVTLESETGSEARFADELRAAFESQGHRAARVTRPPAADPSDVAAALSAGSELARFWWREVASRANAGEIVIVVSAAERKGAVPPEVIRRIDRIATSSCPPSYATFVKAGTVSAKSKNHFDGSDEALRAAQMRAFAQGCFEHRRRQAAILEIGRP